MTATDTRGGPVGALLDAAADLVSHLLDALENDPETGFAILDDLWELADAAVALVETVDLTDLLRTIDWEALPSAVDTEDVVTAVAEGDPGAAVDLRDLVSLADMPSLWDSVDGRAFWRQSRDFGDEVDELAESLPGDWSGDDDRALGDYLPGDWSTDDGDDGALDDYVPGDWDVGDDRSLSDHLPDGGEPDGGETAGDASDGLPGRSDGFDPETLENALQSKISDAVGEFRAGILRAHDRLEAKLAANREQTEAHRNRQTDSRNPTAVSTMPTDRSRGAVGHHSTVPEETRYSTAPNRERVYGDRFDGRQG